MSSETSQLQQNKGSYPRQIVLEPDTPSRLHAEGERVRLTNNFEMQLSCTGEHLQTGSQQQDQAGSPFLPRPMCCFPLLHLKPHLGLPCSAPIAHVCGRALVNGGGSGPAVQVTPATDTGESAKPSEIMSLRVL